MSTKNKYGLSTCIAMIIGIVIGSGIFFKSDNILIATNGNILLGALAFCIAAISIIFGSLSVAELAARNDKPGGIISYAEESYNGGIACALGWFQTFLYYPTLIAVVCYVVGVYTEILFGIEGSLENQILIGLITCIGVFCVNAFASKLAGLFQTSATILKLIPLALIGIAGFVFGNPTQIVQTTNVAATQASNLSWLSALVPIVFAFDGWITATAISHEVKDAKRNVPLALICAPLFILAIYLLYFIGLSTYLGPEVIMATGDSHVDIAANQLFGPLGAKAILVFIIISVLGTANGLTMGLCRSPYSLALRNMFPCSDKVSKINEKFDFPITSTLVGFVIVLFWLGLHYITQKYNLLPNSDVSEISITLNYVAFVLLYVQVLRLGIKREIKSIWKGIVTPILAILGSLIILFVGLQNPLFIYYALICGVLLVSAYMFWKRQTNKA